MVNIIRSLHEGMKTEVRVDGHTAPEFEVRNGLRQGCTIALTLFNLYFNMVVSCWKDRCHSLGVGIWYKYGGNLVGERTRRTSKEVVTELLFADDAAILGPNRECMEVATRLFDEVTSQWGTTVSISKTKLLVAGLHVESDSETPTRIRGEVIEMVGVFKYLGAAVEESERVKKDVEGRIALASRAFGALRRPVFKDKHLSLRTMHLVYHTAVVLYGAETWATKRENTNKLQSFHNRCLRAILGISTAQQRMRCISSVQVSQ